MCIFLYTYRKAWIWMDGRQLYGTAWTRMRVYYILVDTASEVPLSREHGSPYYTTCTTPHESSIQYNTCRQARWRCFEFIFIFHPISALQPNWLLMDVYSSLCKGERQVFCRISQAKYVTRWYGIKSLRSMAVWKLLFHHSPLSVDSSFCVLITHTENALQILIFH